MFQPSVIIFSRQLNNAEYEFNETNFWHTNVDPELLWVDCDMMEESIWPILKFWELIEVFAP